MLRYRRETPRHGTQKLLLLLLMVLTCHESEKLPLTLKNAINWSDGEHDYDGNFCACDKQNDVNDAEWYRGEDDEERLALRQRTPTLCTIC